MRSKNKISILILLLIFSAIFVGCGHIKTESELYDYALKNYILDSDSYDAGLWDKMKGRPGCEIVNYENSGDSSYITLIDRQYGFEFTVISEMTTFGIDGSTAGEYQQTVSDFNKKYMECFYELYGDKIDGLKLDNNYGKLGRYSSGFLDLYNSDPEDELAQLSKYLVKFDRRKYIQDDAYINVYNEDSERGRPVGRYYVRQGRYEDINYDY